MNLIKSTESRTPIITGDNRINEMAQNENEPTVTHYQSLNKLGSQQ